MAKLQRWISEVMREARETPGWPTFAPGGPDVLVEPTADEIATYGRTD